MHVLKDVRGHKNRNHPRHLELLHECIWMQTDHSGGLTHGSSGSDMLHMPDISC